MFTKTLALAVAAASLISVPAAAVSMNGTLAMSPFGASSDTPSIGVGSTFLSSFFSVSGRTGDFDPNAALNTSVDVSPFIFANANSIFFTSSLGEYTGTFTNVTQSGPAANRIVSGYALGSFTPYGVFGTFDSGMASLTLSFTQNGENGAIGGSITLSTPPAVVPEPASWAMLIAGFGLTGAAMRRRATRAVAA